MTTITLTFDNGPDPEVTPHVLKTLARYGVLSTFFVVGEKLRDRRGFAEQAHSAGHWIGNHTYNHIVPLGMSTTPEAATSEITRTEALIGGLAHKRRFFRPFGGGGVIDQRLLNQEALQHLQKNAYTCVLWNVIAHDWSHPQGWVERALDLAFARPHALVVLHDLPTGAMNDLARFIATAKDRGAIFAQDFPNDCVPIEQGKLTTAIAPYVSEDVRDMALN